MQSPSVSSTSPFSCPYEQTSNHFICSLCRERILLDDYFTHISTCFLTEHPKCISSSCSLCTIRSFHQSLINTSNKHSYSSSFNTNESSTFIDEETFGLCDIKHNQCVHQMKGFIDFTADARIVNGVKENLKRMTMEEMLHTKVYF